MGEKTNVEWCSHTWNPWRGCQEVSPGCANCYAREFANRNPSVLGEWGEGTYRAVASDRYFAEPITWNRKAGEDGVRRRVLCGSMMDIFEDRPDLVRARYRAMRVINRCRNLDWLLLTKRPQNIRKLWWEAAWEGRYEGLRGLVSAPHVWMGTTVEDQRRAAERIRYLLAADVHTRFLSCEPLLEEVDLQPWLAGGGIHWVIAGGESRQGGRCRKCDIEWVESIVEQCRRHGVPVFVKQMGSVLFADRQQLKLIDKKGGDINEWPDHLRLRQFPERR
jgi:protein gp37